MTVDRRTLLKSLALGAFLPYFDMTSTAMGFSDPPPPTSVYILLHGFFFLQFEGNSLWAATPQVDGHDVAVRRRGDPQPHLVPRSEISFMDTLQAGSTNSFPAELVTFPGSALGASWNGVGHAANYYCRLHFPLPNNILALRLGPKNQFCPQPGNIGNQLSLGNKVAPILCLVFNPKAGDPYVESYYAEHPQPPTIAEVNGALRSARSLCGDAFDLQLNYCGASSIPFDPDNTLPNGVSSDDEKALSELPPPASSVSGAKSTHTAASKKGHKTDQPARVKGADPSSCPLFGIG